MVPQIVPTVANIVELRRSLYILMLKEHHSFQENKMEVKINLLTVMFSICVNHEEWIKMKQLCVWPFLLIWCSFQRFWRAGGSSLTARFRVCCCSLWAARLNPVERKVWYSSQWCARVCPWLKVDGRRLSPLFLSQRTATIFWWPVPLRWRLFTGQILTTLQMSTWNHLPSWFLCAFGCLLRDVQQRGLSRPLFLSESDQWDAVLCALVIDLDFDGQKEVLLGTYGQVPAPFSWCTFILVPFANYQGCCHTWRWC